MRRSRRWNDHRTHLAHKAEHAVDLETAAVVAVTVQGADEGDTTTSIETLIEAAEQVETVVPEANAWNDRLRISTKPDGCDEFTCAVTTTS